MICDYIIQLSIRYEDTDLYLIEKIKKKCRWTDENGKKITEQSSISEKSIFNVVNLYFQVDNYGKKYLLVLFKISSNEMKFSEIEKKIKKEMGISKVKNKIDISVFEIHFTKYIAGDIEEVFEGIKKYRNEIDSFNKEIISGNKLVFSCAKTKNKKKTEISLTKGADSNVQESIRKIELTDEYPRYMNYIRLDLHICKDQIIWMMRQYGNTKRTIEQILEKGIFEEMEYYYFNRYIPQIFGCSDFVNRQTAIEILQSTDKIKQIAKKNKLNDFLIELNNSLHKGTSNDIDKLWKKRTYRDYITLDLEKKLNINPRLLMENAEKIDNFLERDLEDWGKKLEKNKKRYQFSDSKKNLEKALWLTKKIQFGRVCNENDILINDRDMECLHSEKKAALQLAIKGFNLFISGGAGTGKSYMVNKLSSILKKNGKNVILCAPTGIAADNVNGITIHQVLKIHAYNANVPIVNFSEIPKNTDTIIVDEISMCRCDLFDSLVFSIVKSCEQYNKKIQLIVIGDFYQLPPVLTSYDKRILDVIYEKDILSGYAFMGVTWDFCNFKYIELQESQRQTKRDFIDACNKLRVGDSTSIDYFNEHCAKDEDPFSKDNVIYISSYKKEIEEINAKIKSDTKSYPVIFTINDKGDDSCYEFDIENEKFSNKKGHYYNGMMGMYIKKHICANNEEYAIVRINKNSIYLAVKKRTHIIPYATDISEDEYKIRYREEMKYPFEKAYAITIHKSQGMTLDKIVLLPKNFTNGQLYVALTRCKEVTDIYLNTKLTIEDIKCDENVSCFYNQLRKMDISIL